LASARGNGGDRQRLLRVRADAFPPCHLRKLNMRDFYDQKNGTGTQGDGQRLISYGGPGGPRIEIIPAYDWEVILAEPYVSASGPRGTGQGIGDWPLFLVKYRLAYANENNGDYIVTALFPDVQSERYG